MRRRAGLLARGGMVIALTVLLLGVTVAYTAAQEPPAEVHLFADAREAGAVTLSFYGAFGTPVVFYERIGNRLERLGGRTSPSGQPTVLVHAVTWRCDRLVRRFVADTVTPTGQRTTASYDVRTPSCRTRFELDVPRRAARDRTARIRVVDRWSNGAARLRLCIRPPRGDHTCSTLTFARAVAVVTRRFRPRTSGRWRIELRFRDRTTRRSTTVGRGEISARPPLTVLATGDSSMQGIDSYLADELGDAATVRSDVRPGTGLVKPGGPWETLADVQSRAVKQDVTVMSIGATDDFRLRAFDGSVHECCDEGWVAEYAGRVRQTMRTYLRGGRARVVWLTLPIPRGRRPFATTSVNDAILRAAAGVPGVTVLRMDLVFTPAGHRELMSFRGRAVRIFRDDGVHLTITGTAIAAKLAAAAVRGR
jgi:hypothetical protein